MARLHTIGYELNSTAQAVEFRNVTGTVTIVTTTVRTGTYSLRVQGGAANFHEARFSNPAGNGTWFGRIYINIATLPGTITDIFNFVTDASARRAAIRLATDGTLELWDSAGKIGASSSALSTGTWYRIELSYFNNTVSGNAELNGLLNGTSFASTTTSLNTGAVGHTRIGNIDGVASLDIYYDDYALNDSTGSNQTGFPGSGAVIILRPNATGDNAQFTRGGTDSGANWSQTSEVTPNDATDFNSDKTLNNTDDFNIGASGLTGTDGINVVAVGVRTRGSAATLNSGIVLRVKDRASGSVTEGNQIKPTSTTWLSNTRTAQETLYSLVTYTKPSGGAWSSTDLDNAQIGYRTSAADTNNIDVSTVWMIIDYDAGQGTTTSTTTSSSTSTSTTTTTSSSTSSTSTSTSTSSTSSSTTTSTSSSSSTSSSTSSTSSSTSSTSTSSTSTTQTFPYFITAVLA